MKHSAPIIYDPILLLALPALVVHGTDRPDQYEVVQTNTVDFQGNGGDDYLVVYDAKRGALSGGSGDDVLVSSGNVTISGGAGNDTMGNIAYPHSHPGRDSLVAYGGSGDDVVGLDDSRLSYYKVYLGDGNDGFYTSYASSVAGGVVHGGRGNDSLGGTDGHDEIFGDTGNDLINTSGSPHLHGKGDVLRGGSGNDTIVSHDITSVCYGNAGNDTFDGGGRILAGSGNDTISAFSGTTKVIAGSGSDLITGAKLVIAGIGADTIAATAQSDAIWLGVDHNRDELREGFETGSHDRVYQFEDGVDIIAVTNKAIGSISDFQIADTITAGHSGALITYGGSGSVFLANLHATDIGADDFAFGA